MSNIQNSKKFRQRASLLQDQAALHGVTMVPGEADELLADQTKAEAMSIMSDGADAIVNIGAAIRAADSAGHIELGGQALVWTRGILVEAISLLRSGRWACPCKDNHVTASTCTLASALTRDLNRVGGWASPEEIEPPNVKLWLAIC